MTSVHICWVQSLAEQLCLGVTLYRSFLPPSLCLFPALCQNHIAFFLTIGCVLAFGEDQCTYLSILKQWERKIPLTVLILPSLTLCWRTLKFDPRLHKGFCLRLVALCQLLWGSQSVGEHLSTKMFSCMNASHVLGGLVLVKMPFPTLTEFHNEKKIDLVMMNYPFLLK